MAHALTSEEVRKVAFLSRLKLSAEEIGDLTSKLANVLEYVETLNEVDTTDVEPLVHAVELSNVFRKDVIVESLPRAAALQNAPKSDGVYFLVPQILEDK